MEKTPPQVKKATPQISLRPFDLSDVDDFLVWAGDDHVTQFCSWDTYTSRDNALNFLKEVTVSHPWYRAICIDNRPIGSIFVLPGTGNDAHRGAIGYALGREYWGQGIATLAVKMVISSIFSEFPDLERVEGLVIAENEASQRVLEKAGFLREGLLRKYTFVKGKSRDIVIYSFLATDLMLR
ncbi:uncharacterized protein LOC131224085 [Magnolia sinica]|uniref:uncharacterized protein LOC131224085 n=1 Tax=Magnolia sinica TaxID=86752 RepID=UPI002659452C|nr:uncharacterized protein LOC131224085 [Magnolia sinica]